MLATQAAERGLSGALEMTRRHGLSGGNSEHPAMLAEPVSFERTIGNPAGPDQHRPIHRVLRADRCQPDTAAGRQPDTAAGRHSRSWSHRGGWSHVHQDVGFEPVGRAVS